MAGLKKALNPCLTWIELSNADQCEWAVKYLEKIGLGPPLGSTDVASSLLQKIQPWVDHPNPVEIERRMKGAWARRKHARKEEGKRPWSYALPEETHKKLKSLAKEQGKPANGLLQALIENFDNELEKAKARVSAQSEIEVGKTKHLLRKKFRTVELDEYQHLLKDKEDLAQRVRDLTNEIAHVKTVGRDLLRDRCARDIEDWVPYHYITEIQQQRFADLCIEYGVARYRF